MIVVNEVRNIGSKRARPASRMASSIESPDFRFRLIYRWELWNYSPRYQKAQRGLSAMEMRGYCEWVSDQKKTPMREGIGARMRTACLYELNYMTIVPTIKEQPKTHSYQERLYWFGIFIVDTSDNKIVSFWDFCDTGLIVFAACIEFFGRPAAFVVASAQTVRLTVRFWSICVIELTDDSREFSWDRRERHTALLILIFEPFDLRQSVGLTVYHTMHGPLFHRIIWKLLSRRYRRSPFSKIMLPEKQKDHLSGVSGYQIQN